jgi:hypothetical protein
MFFPTLKKEIILFRHHLFHKPASTFTKKFSEVVWLEFHEQTLPDARPIKTKTGAPTDWPRPLRMGVLVSDLARICRFQPLSPVLPCSGSDEALIRAR